MPYARHGMIGCNCKDCDKRYLGCHDHCESYKKAKSEYRDKMHFVAVQNRERVSPLNVRYSRNEKAWRRNY